MSEELIVAAKHEDEEDEEQQQQSEEKSTTMSRQQKRKEMKKKKRREKRRELAEKEREEEEAKLNDPEELKKMELLEEEERLRMEKERFEFEERERIWLEKIRKKDEEEEEEERRRKKVLDDSDAIEADENDYGSDWEYMEEGQAEIIWKGNEIIVKKKKVRVPKMKVDQHLIDQDVDRPTSNPLPPQSEVFTDYKNASKLSAPEVYKNVALQVPNFGTEQDKSHCPFHIKTGACRFGQRCSRVHFYPDKSCTLLIKNMYNGPGLAWEQDEGLEYTDEEVERCYEEFYEDVHTEFLKFGEIVNFKVCKNGSFHLRGNVYAHFKSLESAMLAYQYINGRFFAGKQLTCEYVGVIKWKIAICGEYMKSRLKTCSRGTACNFIHCFRNPGGDYEWADWDKPPPRYWIKKMTSLFGYSDDAVMESENRGRSRSSNQISPADESRHRSRRSKSREIDGLSSGSGRRLHAKNDEHGSVYYKGRSDERKRSKVRDEKKREHGTNINDYHLHKREVQDFDSDRDSCHRDSDRYAGREKRRSRRGDRVSELKDDYGDNMESDTRHGRTRESSRRRSRAREADSDEYVADLDTERDTCLGRTRESSRHRSRTREADSDEYVADLDMERDTRLGRTRESSRHRSRTREADSDEYVADLDMERDTRLGRTRESSRHRSRTREADSDEYVADLDMKRDTRLGRTRESSRHRSRTREADSDEYVADLDLERDTSHGRTRESSRHRNKENRDHKRKMSVDTDSGRKIHSHENEEVSELSNGYGDKKNMNAESDTARDISEERLKETRHEQTRKSTRHSHRGSSDLNGRGGTRKRDHDTDSGGDWSDTEKGGKKYHHHKRKSSTHGNCDEIERMPV